MAVSVTQKQICMHDSENDNKIKTAVIFMKTTCQPEEVSAVKP
jgi:hypothetical protein